MVFIVAVNTFTLTFSPYSRFDVGPILGQVFYRVPEKCSADELSETLATKGAHLVSMFFLLKMLL